MALVGITSFSQAKPLDADTLIVKPPHKITLYDSLQSDSLIKIQVLPYQGFIDRLPFTDIDDFDPYKPEAYLIKKVPQTNNLLIFIVVLNIAFLIAIVKISSERNLISFVNSMFSNTNAFKNFSGQKSVFTPINVQLLLIFILMLSLGIFLYEGIVDQMPWQPVLSFAIIFFALTVMFTLKIFIHFLFEQLLQMEKVTIIISNHTIGINFLFTMIMFPIYLINYLNNSFLNINELMIVGFILFVITLFYRTLREVVLLKLVFPYPTIYLILYLCATEIFPWLIFFKLIFR
jgi:hypothetical protein